MRSLIHRLRTRAVPDAGDASDEALITAFLSHCGDGTLSPRNRERYWYSVIALAHVDGPEARTEAKKLIAPLKDAGFVVAPPAKSRPIVKEKPDAKIEKPEEKSPKKKKK